MKTIYILMVCTIADSGAINCNGSNVQEVKQESTQNKIIANDVPFTRGTVIFDNDSKAFWGKKSTLEQRCKDETTR